MIAFLFGLVSGVFLSACCGGLALLKLAKVRL